MSFNVDFSVTSMSVTSLTHLSAASSFTLIASAVDMWLNQWRGSTSKSF